MNFTRANLTDLGLSLNAKIQSGVGEIPLHITRIALGVGTSEKPTSQTDLVSPIDFFVPITRQVSHDNLAEIQLQITNVGNPEKGIPPLARTVTFQQIGFFAIDPDEGEILYRISQLESPAFIPPAASFPYTVMPVYVFSTANAENVTIVVDPAGLVTVRMLGEHDVSLMAHQNLFEKLWARLEGLSTPETRPELLREIQELITEHFTQTALPAITDKTENLIAAHNIAPDTHQDIRAKLSMLYGRVGRLEDMIISNITSNPFLVTFADLSDVLVSGVWNQAGQRIEF